VKLPAFVMISGFVFCSVQATGVDRPSCPRESILAAGRLQDDVELASHSTGLS